MLITSPLRSHLLPPCLSLLLLAQVDFGPENSLSPDGRVYMVGNGCLAPHANSNCSWISGDAVFLARTVVDAATGEHAYRAADPDSINQRQAWEYYCGEASGEGECWTAEVSKAAPILTWKGRVGTVTATWHPVLKRFLVAITTPTVLPSTVGPYDTWVLEAASLTASSFKLVAYLPRFGQQAYFVSFPSRFLGTGKGASASASAREAVMAFSANFACKTGGCEPNIRGASYGANLLPVRFGG